MYQSARLKLTFFYLAAIIIVSLISTVGIRIFAEHIFDNSTLAQRGGIKALIRRQVGLQIGDNGFRNIQAQQNSIINNELNGYVIYINAFALLVGGVASYWFAGRTLRPIQESHNAQARFASDASHELRTPLTTMMTENEVFLRQASFTKEEAKEQIESNLEEVKRLEQMATNLLALTTTEQNQQALTLSPISAVGVSDLAIAQLKNLQPKSFKRVVSKVADQKIIAHRDSIAQILTIFLDNALKYSPAREEVTLGGKREGGIYSFSVTDHGPGIAAEDMPNIFDRLYRGDKNRSHTIPGNGLGLSLAIELAKANGAGLSVTNVEEGGAMFSLKIRIN